MVEINKYLSWLKLKQPEKEGSDPQVTVKIHSVVEKQIIFCFIYFIYICKPQLTQYFFYLKLSIRAY